MEANQQSKVLIVINGYCRISGAVVEVGVEPPPLPNEGPQVVDRVRQFFQSNRATIFVVIIVTIILIPIAVSLYLLSEKVINS